MGRALQRLSAELYSRDTHFVLELVQNSDDNAYAPGACVGYCASARLPVYQAPIVTHTPLHTQARKHTGTQAHTGSRMCTRVRVAGPMHFSLKACFFGLQE